MFRLTVSVSSVLSYINLSVVKPRSASLGSATLDGGNVTLVACDTAWGSCPALLPCIAGQVRPIFACSVCEDGTVPVFPC